MVTAVAEGPDFDDDGDVDGFDFMTWQRGFGTTGAAARDGDSNGDGQVDAVDLAQVSALFGTGSSPVAVVVQTGDFNLDGRSDDADFLALQRGHGTQETAALVDGDGNSDGDVDGSDAAIWSEVFGSLAGAGSESPAAAATLSGTPWISPPLATVSTDSTASANGDLGFRVATTPPAAATEPAVLPGSGRFLAFAAQAHRHTPAAALFARPHVAAEVRARLEMDTDDTATRSRRDLAELGATERDQALDHLFGARRKAWGHVQRADEQHRLAEEALEVALTDQIDWRLG